MDIVGVVASIASIIDLSAKIVGYIKDVKGGKQERHKLLLEVHAFTTLLPILQQRMKNAHPAAVIALSIPLQQCQATLLDLQSKLATAQLSASQKLIWPFQKGGIADVLTQLERLKSYVTLALADKLVEMAEAIRSDLAEVLVNQQAESIRAVEMQKGIKHLTSTVVENQQQELANWISPLDFNQEQSEAFGKRTEGTGTWLLEAQTFKGWVGDEYKILWCPGNPGVGKTIIASIIINHLQEYCITKDKATVLFIYCNYTKAYSVLQLIEALLKQLALHHVMTPTSTKLLKDLQARNCHASRDELLHVLKAEIEACSRVFIVVDALDECSEEVRTDLLTNLRSLTTGSSARLLGTSRDIDAIAHDIRANARLNITAKDKDIRSYLESRITIPGRLQRLVTGVAGGRSSIEDLVVTKIMEKARGMFLLARLHMDNLANKSKRNEVLKALETLPDGFEATYDEALARINRQSNEGKQLAYHVLSWVSRAYRPLSLLELRYAVAVRENMTQMDEDDLDDEEFVTSVCVGLVTFNQESRQVGLVHYTTQQYLERVRDQGLHPFLSPAQLTITCLTYLSFNWPGSTEDALSVAPFLKYAARGWGVHSSRLDDPGTVMNAFKRFTCSDVKMTLVANILLPSQGTQDLHASGLHLCSYFGLEHIAERIFSDGQNAEPQDCNVQTPLHYAVLYGHGRMVSLLLGKGNVDVNARDNNGHTPLMIAAKTHLHTNIAKLLVEIDSIEIDARDNLGRTALSWAASCGAGRVVQLLLTTGTADINARDNNGRTPLTLAVEGGHRYMVQLLLATETADVNAKDNNGRTPLSLAVEGGCTAMVRLLLVTGMGDVNAKDNNGRTPLSLAVEGGCTTMVRLLLTDVNARDHDGRTPLAWVTKSLWEKLQLLVGTLGVDMKTVDEVEVEVSGPSARAKVSPIS